MVAVINSRDGGPILAADCCVSLSFDRGRPTVHRDELQKVYAMTPGLAIAYATDDVPSVLHALRKMPDEYNEVAIQNALTDDPRDLVSIISHLFRNYAPRATVHLGVLVAPPTHGAYAFTWISDYPNVANDVKPGEARILGSGAAIRAICQAAEYSAFIRDINSLTACARFADSYIRHYHSHYEEWTALGVGGLLHFAIVNEERQVGYSETALAVRTIGEGYTNGEEDYVVSMRYDEGVGQWRQRRSDGAEIGVVNGLQSDLSGDEGDLLFLTDENMV